MNFDKRVREILAEAEREQREDRRELFTFFFWFFTTLLSTVTISVSLFFGVFTDHNWLWLCLAAIIVFCGQCHILALVGDLQKEIKKLREVR